MKQNGTKSTMRDVALAAGVSLQTVSRVLNGGDHVKPTTRAHIHAAMKKLNYQPNEAARVLRGQRAKTIGLIVPDLADPFFAACAHAIQQVAADSDYMTFVLTWERKPGLERTAIRLMAERNVAGLLIIPSEPSSADSLAGMVAERIPVVTLDRILEGSGCAEVTVDNIKAAKAAVEHLVAHGHKRILAIGYDCDTSTVAERISGYRLAMANARLKPEVTRCRARDTVQVQLIERLKTKPLPTAIFTLSDVVTIHVLHVLNRGKIEIPKAMALISFDDFELAPLLKVPVTAIRQSGDEMGRTAARLLFDQIRSGEVPSSPPRMLLGTELILRRSCGCNQLPAAG